MGEEYCNIVQAVVDTLFRLSWRPYVVDRLSLAGLVAGLGGFELEICGVLIG